MCAHERNNEEQNRENDNTEQRNGEEIVAQDSNVNENTSQNVMDTQSIVIDTELRREANSLDLEEAEAEANGTIDDDTATEVDELSLGGDRLDDAGDESTESLTFDENHFSTPTGGATPERRDSPNRRRTTASSVDDSEVSRTSLRA